MLGIHLVHAQLAWLGKSILDGLFGDFVEHNALKAAIVPANGFTQVPGYGFSFTVQVRCQVNFFGVLGQAFELVNHLFFARQNFVTGFPAVVRINTHASDQLASGPFLGAETIVLLATLGCRATAGGQITNMSDTGFDHVLVTQVFIDGLGFGRGFHNNQRFTHNSNCPGLKTKKNLPDTDTTRSSIGTITERLYIVQARLGQACPWHNPVCENAFTP